MVKTDSKSSTENIMAAVALKKKKLSVSKNEKRFSSYINAIVILFIFLFRISGSSDRSLDDLNSIDDISMIGNYYKKKNLDKYFLNSFVCRKIAHQN